LKKNHPVILQHGLLDDAFTWMINQKDLNLPFMLADSGYEVFVTNSRGSKYSLGHTDPTKYNPNHIWGPFYDFSFDEMGKYDDPAYITLVKSITGQDLVHWVGHSQGTTQFFVVNSIDDDFSNKIKSFTGLGPVTFVNHQYSPLF
jgi:lysosomal acid lipase/cholesteryl ester hydrolase